MSKRYICIHGHFYQPPREHAWLEKIEVQESAKPFHDWNERINYECYAPNAAARILDENGYIRKIINNYERISFNFGPTLLQWLEQADRQTYQSLILADRRAFAHFGGHGPALAQVYSHLIMPLANRRDKITQVHWGIRDFEHRFGRKPEGMWLAETAVDTETLEVLAEQGIRFTILAPRQAAAVRRIGGGKWEEVHEHSLNTQRAYLCKLPSGSEINLFFYQGEISRGVAFEGLLNNGKAFADRLMGALGPEGEEAQLLHIATDGETYGHHHRYGEMALADCLETIEEASDIELTVYGRFLELHPPQYEARIHDNSSWSCVHGVERWRADCGCNTGGTHYHQRWRAPLREALDWLREELADIYEKFAGRWLKDPWQARNDYVEVILRRGDERRKTFLQTHLKAPLAEADTAQLLRLMEMQRQAMQMYTSCGWFFDELSGIETLQILQYALRAINYAQQVSQRDLLPAFLHRLEKAPSNVMADGGDVFRRRVLPARVELEHMGMHLAASSVFEEYPEQLDLFIYHARSLEFRRLKGGIFRLAMGRTLVRSQITLSEKRFSFVVLHLGQQHLIGHISRELGPEQYAHMEELISEAFQEPDLERVIYLMDHFFDGERFSFRQLFADEKLRILQMMAHRAIARAEEDLREMYADNYQLMSAMLNDGLPIPRTYRDALTFVLNRDLHQFFSKTQLYVPSMKNTVREMEKWGVEISDPAALRLEAGQRLHQELLAMEREGYPDFMARQLVEVLEQLQKVGIETNFWQCQNLFYQQVHNVSIGALGKEQREALSALAQQLKILVEFG